MPRRFHRIHLLLPALALLGLAMISTSGCNTVGGIGDDLGAAGRGISDASGTNDPKPADSAEKK